VQSQRQEAVFECSARHFFGMIFYYGYFFYTLIKYKTANYFWIAVYNSVLLLFFLGYTFFGDIASQRLLVLSFILLSASCVFLAVWLEIKLSPKLKGKEKLKC